MKGWILRNRRGVIALLIAAVVLAVGVIVNASPQSVIEQYSSSDVPKLAQTGNRMLLEEKMDSALMIYNILLNTRNHEKYPRETNDALNNGGYIYFYFYSDYEKAYQYWLQGIEHSIKNDLPYRETTLLNLGNVYLMLENFDKALDYYRQAFELAGKSDNYNVLFTTYNNIALIQFSDLDKQNVMGEIQDYDFSTVPDSVPMKAYTLNLQRGLQAVAQKRELEAIPYFKQAAENINTPFTPDRFETCMIEACGEIYSRNNKLKEARGEYLKADSIARKYEQYDHRIGVNKSLAEIYKKMGRKDLAQQHTETAYAMTDSVFNSKLINSMHELETKSEIDKVTEQMREIEHQRTVQLIILVAVAIFALVVTGLLIWILKLYRRESAKNKVLYQMNMELVYQEPPKAEPKASKISDDTRKELLPKIEALLASDAIYAPDFSIDYIVEATESNQRYVSQIVNEAYGKSLSALLIELRIREACRLLSDTANLYTVETIAGKVGYRSRSSFSKAFSKVTGLTPTEFIKNAKEAEN